MDDDSAVPDRELIAAVRQGDPSAFESLHRRYYPVVRQAIAEMVPDSDLIDDAVQDTFIKAMEQMSALREADQVSAWLTSIAGSAATDAANSVPTVAIGEMSEAELAEVRELVHLVRGAFTALSPRDLRAVAHVGYLNASTDDLAESLAITPAATTGIVHRAHGRLRNARKLELLVRQAGGACAEFVALVNASKVHEAGKHLASCTQCQQAASAQLGSQDAAARANRSASLTISGPDGSWTMPLVELLTIGRFLDDVVHGLTLLVDGDAVSRHHAEIHTTGGAAMFVDTSSNGSMINDKLITAESVLLHDGDVITIRSTVLTFHAGTRAHARTESSAGPTVTVATDYPIHDVRDPVRAALRPMVRFYDGHLIEDSAGRLVASWGQTGERAAELAHGFCDDAASLVTQITSSVMPQEGWTVTLS